MTTERIGNRVVGTVLSVKGTCSAGHKAGDKFELSMHGSDGLCGVFYHDIFPWMLAFQLGGELPWGENKDVMVIECLDRVNSVRLELRKIKN